MEAKNNGYTRVHTHLDGLVGGAQTHLQLGELGLAFLRERVLVLLLQPPHRVAVGHQLTDRVAGRAHVDHLRDGVALVLRASHEGRRQRKPEREDGEVTTNEDRVRK